VLAEVGLDRHRGLTPGSSFYAATRKLRVDPDLAERKVQLLARGRVVRIEPEDVVAAIELHRLKRISFGDALIVHGARLSGAGILYTEDLQHGATFGAVRIVNPFLGTSN
jgi:predicted nucleic acid-binding protein